MQRNAELNPKDKQNMSDVFDTCLGEHEKMLEKLESTLRTMETFVLVKAVQKGKSGLRELAPEFNSIREDVEQIRNRLLVMKARFKVANTTKELKSDQPAAESANARPLVTRGDSDISQRLDQLGLGYLNDEDLPSVSIPAKNPGHNMEASLATGVNVKSVSGVTPASQPNAYEPSRYAGGYSIFPSGGALSSYSNAKPGLGQDRPVFKF